MLEVIQSSKHSRDTVHTHIKQQQQTKRPLSSVQLLVLPPPPASLFASADGLQMNLLLGGQERGEEAEPRREPCRCHETIDEYLAAQLRQTQTQRQAVSRATPVSGSCASVDELTESDSWEVGAGGGVLVQDRGTHALSTCSRPTCLVLHCLAFKIADQLCPAPAAPLHIAPSRLNPAFQQSEQAKRARLEAVQEAQSGRGSHVQVSDVTLELMDQLRNDWGEGED